MSAVNGPVIDGTYSIPVSGSNAPPCQSAPPTEPGNWTVPLMPPGLSPRTDGGVNTGPIRYCLTSWIASARNSGVKSMRSSTETPWRSNGGGLVGKGCVGEVRSPGVSEPGTGRSSIGQTGLPLVRSKTNTSACFVSCTTALIGVPPTVMSARIGAAGRS